MAERHNLSIVGCRRGEVFALCMEGHGRFSPAAVQIGNDLSQALPEASRSRRVEEGDGEAGESK